jgi:hypothetical protein
MDRGEPEDDAVLREAMLALDMPVQGIGRWLDYLERFYRRHGGERRYGECLSLVASMRRVLAEERR